MKYLALLFIFLPSVYAAQFSSFSDIGGYEATAVKIDLSNFPKLSKFESKLSSEIAAGPNFAGHYFVGFVPCGSPCQGNVLIDLNTGTVTDTLTTCYGMEYQLDSRLFIANPGYPNEKSCPQQFYEVVGGKFILVVEQAQ